MLLAHEAAPWWGRERAPPSRPRSSSMPRELPRANPGGAPYTTVVGWYSRAFVMFGATTPINEEGCRAKVGAVCAPSPALVLTGVDDPAAAAPALHKCLAKARR